MEHVVLLAERLAAAELLIEAAQRRALVPGDEGGGAKPATAVGPVLVERDAHQRLEAG